MFFLMKTNHFDLFEEAAKRAGRDKKSKAAA